MRVVHATRVTPAGRSGQDRAQVFDYGDGYVVVVADGAGGMGNGLAAADAIVSAVEAVGQTSHDWCALLAALGADCHSPVAALATLEGEGLRLRAEILTEEGAEHVRVDRHGLAGTPREMAALAGELLAAASPALRAMFGH